MKTMTQKWMIALPIALASISLATQAFADISYGYAEQTVSNIVVSGTSLTARTPTGTSTTASAVANGSGVATNNSLDAPEAYVLTGPAAPQNSFVKYSTNGGGPQAGDFSRGDTLVTTGGSNIFTNGITGSTVAESSATSATLLTGSADWQASGTFTSTDGSVTVNYNYANDIVALVSGSGADTSEATFSFVISIKDQHGHEIDATPAELNTAISAPTNGPEVITSGTGSATLSLAGLTAGDIYTIAINSGAFTSVTTGVPEAASLRILLPAMLLLKKRSR